MEQARLGPVAASDPAGWLGRFFTLHGRARRRDLGYLYLVSAVLNLLAVRGTGMVEPFTAAFAAGWSMLWAYLWVAMMVRRLHDQGHSGWWALLLYAIMGLIVLGIAQLPQQEYGGFHVTFLQWEFHAASGPATTILGLLSFAIIIAMAVMSLLPPQRGPNRYGPDPRANEDE